MNSCNEWVIRVLYIPMIICRFPIHSCTLVPFLVFNFVLFCERPIRTTIHRLSAVKERERKIAGKLFNLYY